MTTTKKRITSIIIAAAAVISMAGAAQLAGTQGLFPDFSPSASAAQAVDYITASGETRTITDYTRVYSDTKTLKKGWYVVDGNVTVSSRMKVTGTVNLVITDGSTLTAKKGINVDKGAKLNIYNLGTLYAGTTNGSNSTITSGDTGIGGIGAEVNVYGGRLYARGGSSSYGICGNKIRLYPIDASDTFWASSYNSSVNLCGVFADKVNGIAYNNSQVPANELKGVTLSAASIFTSGTRYLENATYAVFDNIVTSDRLEVLGNVDLILARGSVLKARQGITVNDGNSLNIFGTTGKLYAGTTTGSDFTANSNNAGIGAASGKRAGSITVYGGSVYANGGSNAAGIGGDNASVQIAGGYVSAYGGSYAAGLGSGYADRGSGIRISGGNVTAVGGMNAAGIGSGYSSSNSQIFLGFTNLTDTIYASSYSGSIQFTNTMYLNDTGDIARAGNIDGKTLAAQIQGYVISFNSNGGTPVDSVRVPAGSYMSQPATPTKSGYSFAGWYLDSACTRAFDYKTTRITQSTTLYAKWANSNPTIYFETGRGSSVSPITVNYGGYLSERSIPTPTLQGYKFLGWYTDSQANYRFNFNNPIYSTTTLYAGWSYLAEYTVYFDTGSETYISPMTVQEGDTIRQSSIIDPIRAGYKFAGWYSDYATTKMYNFQTPVTHNTTIYAKWIPTTSYYTVKFVTNTRETVSDQTVEAGKTLPIVPYVTKDGYTFDGWYKDAKFTTPFNYNEAINANITLYAKWSENSVYCKVKFNTNGGDPVRDQDVIKGSTISILPYMVKSGYTFEGWYYDRELKSRFYDNDPIYSDITLYAKWTEDKVYCVVGFITNNGESVGDQVVAKGTQIPVLPYLIKNGYEFDGWYTDERLTKKFDETSPIYSDMLIYAKWSEAKKYTVYFETFGGTPVSAQQIEKGKTATIPYDPQLDKYFFRGWYTEEQCINAFNFGTPINENMTLYAKWEYNENYGNAYEVGSTFGGAGLIAAIVGGIAVLGGGAAAAVVISKKKKK